MGPTIIDDDTLADNLGISDLAVLDSASQAAFQWLQRESLSQSNGTKEIVLFKFALALSTEGDEWAINQSWLSSENNFEWYGSSCDISGQIEQTSLNGNILSYTLPTEMGLLTSLTHIDFGRTSCTLSFLAVSVNSQIFLTLISWVRLPILFSPIPCLVPCFII